MHGNHDHLSYCGPVRRHLPHLSLGGRFAGAQMNFMEWTGLLLCLGIFVYLIMALLYPEKF
jgi:K+-transporting ATPase KdpF subunit